MSDNKDYDVPHNEELKEQLPNINNLKNDISNYTIEDHVSKQGIQSPKSSISKKQPDNNKYFLTM